MTDHKFTVDDVIKALELCSKLDLSFEECDKCPYKGECGTKDGNMPADALALINRQMRELDDLKRDTIPKLQNGLERANYYGLKADEEIEYLKAEIESLNAIHADMTESLRIAAEANKDMQAEIERLESLYEKIGIANDAKFERICVLQEDLETAKSEAVKECVKKVKDWAYTKARNDRQLFEWYDEIDKLAQEMTEETK